MNSFGDEIFRVVKRTVAREGGRAIGKRVVAAAMDLVDEGLPRAKAGVSRMMHAMSDWRNDMHTRLAQRHVKGPGPENDLAIPQSDAEGKRGKQMATDWKAILRHKAPEFTREEIDRMSDETARGYYYSEIAPRERAKKLRKRGEVCFTGFTVTEHKALAEIAIQKGLLVRKSVTESLDILVTGPNAGPRKVEKAQAQRAKIMSEAEFRTWANSNPHT